VTTTIGFSAAVRDWVLHNVDAGVPPGPLVRLLVQQGYAPEPATAVVQTLWAARASGTPPPEGSIDAAAVQAARYRYGDPRLASASTILAGGRSVRVALRLEQPMVALLDGVFSDDECDALVALARPRLRPSTIVDPASGQDVSDQARTSEGMFFQPLENPLVERIDRRLAEVMGLPVDRGEGLQVLRYTPGARSAPHFDFLIPSNTAAKDSLARSGQRVSTLVAYLQEPQDGGETVFPEAGISVTPRKGSALYFEYCNRAGQLDPLSLHAALPVLAGEKWVATRWMRERTFRSAGQAA
jgi:prolyl 4-hydroxylase